MKKAPNTLKEYLAWNSAMNIPKDILTNAYYHNLETISTGGGMDYIFCSVRHTEIPTKEDERPNAILVHETHDGSPKTMDEICAVAVFYDMDWYSGFHLIFDNCDDAMDFMERFKNAIEFGDERINRIRQERKGV